MTTLVKTTQEIFDELKTASFEGLAGAAAPTPMNVTDGTRTWHIPQGVCGNAVVMVSNGRTKFAQELKKLGLADTWYGQKGIALKTYGFMGFAHGGQSMAYNEAIAQAMVDHLNSYGIEAYVHSWID